MARIVHCIGTVHMIRCTAWEIMRRITPPTVTAPNTHGMRPHHATRREAVRCSPFLGFSAEELTAAADKARFLASPHLDGRLEAKRTVERRCGQVQRG